MGKFHYTHTQAHTHSHTHTYTHTQAHTHTHTHTNTHIFWNVQCTNFKNILQQLQIFTYATPHRPTAIPGLFSPQQNGELCMYFSFCSWLFLNVVVAFSSLARILGECSTIHSRPRFFYFYFLLVEVGSRTQCLSQLKRLWLSVHWRVACELVSW